MATKPKSKVNAAGNRAGKQFVVQPKRIAAKASKFR